MHLRGAAVLGFHQIIPLILKVPHSLCGASRTPNNSKEPASLTFRRLAPPPTGPLHRGADRTNRSVEHMEFYPGSAPVPAEYRTSRLFLRPLRTTDVELDYDAVMSSDEMLRRTLILSLT